MPVHSPLDRPDLRAVDPADPPATGTTSDTGVHDISTLWLDLGGSD